MRRRRPVRSKTRSRRQKPAEAKRSLGELELAQAKSKRAGCFLAASSFVFLRHTKFRIFGMDTDADFFFPSIRSDTESFFFLSFFSHST
jgi:hypothetical protein